MHKQDGAQQGIENVVTASDYKDRAFGEATGTYVKELGLLTRAAFVVDSDNKVTHVEYLGEIAEQPKFEEVINAAKAAK